MHVPAPFAAPSDEACLALIEANGFAVLVSVIEGAPFATHIPLMLDRERGAHGTLLGHVARANPHWHAFARGTPSLAVFTGPHAYVSPRWYATREKVVPTWNYAAVHAYGTPRTVEDEATVRGYLDRLVAREEAGAAEPWTTASQPTDFIAGMMRGLVAFEMPVERLEGKFKLSQNRPAADHAGVVEALEGDEDPLSRAVAALMRE